MGLVSRLNALDGQTLDLTPDAALELVEIPGDFRRP